MLVDPVRYGYAPNGVRPFCDRFGYSRDYEYHVAGLLRDQKHVIIHSWGPGFGDNVVEVTEKGAQWVQDNPEQPDA